MFIDVNGPSNAPPGNLEVRQHLLDGRRVFLGDLRRRLASPDDAEDVLQDFYLKVIRAARPADQGEKINAWMARILRNTLIDHYRRRAVRHRTETAYAYDLEPIVTSVANHGPGHCQCLYSVLPTLRPEYAEILRRADLEEEPRARIAADLGLTANTLNVRLHRARLALRHGLEKSCLPGLPDGQISGMRLRLTCRL